MQKWKINNYDNRNGYRKNGKLYQFEVELIPWANYAEHIREIRSWISDECIDALESDFDFIWYFRYDRDRMTLLLTWSE